MTNETITIGFFLTVIAIGLMDMYADHKGWWRGWDDPD